MALVTKPNTFTAGTAAVAGQVNSNFDTLYNDYNGNITNVNLSGNAGITDSNLAKITSASKVAISAIENGTTLGTGQVEFIIGNRTDTITAGIAGDIRFPWACTISGAYLFADQSGSIVIDLWKQTYASYPPLVAQTITASAKPTLSSATKYSDTTLTGWTTSVAAGDIIRINVDSATTVTQVALLLTFTRT